MNYSVFFIKNIPLNIQYHKNVQFLENLNIILYIQKQYCLKLFFIIILNVLNQKVPEKLCKEKRKEEEGKIFGVFLANSVIKKQFVSLTKFTN